MSKLFIELQQVELLKNTANRYACICKNSLSFKIKVKLYEKTCKLNVIKQWRLLGLRAACVFCHSEVDAPTSHLDRYYGKKHHTDTICNSNIL